MEDYDGYGRFLVEYDLTQNKDILQREVMVKARVNDDILSIANEEMLKVIFYYLTFDENDLTEKEKKQIYHEAELTLDLAPVIKVQIMPLCEGCQTDQPNQLAHMDEPYGCLAESRKLPIKKRRKH
jgi:hypothetical protein